MKLLALETAVTPGSIAVLQMGPGEPPVVELAKQIDLPADRRTAQVLAASLRELLDAMEWKATDLDAVAVTVGPGSFTGLRLGVTTAKTLAYAAETPCVAINTLAVLAAQATAEASGWAVLDAQRNELFAASFAEQKLTSEPAILPVDAWLSTLVEGDCAIGPVVSRHASQLPPGVTIVEAGDCRLRAETVARLAAAALEAGVAISPFELAPNYYRLSAAEEKRLA